MPVRCRGNCIASAAGPVDSVPPPAHCPGVSKKPHKIEEPKAAYPAKKPVKAASAPAGPRQVDDAAFKRITDKIFTERKDLLRKLAQ